MKQNKSTIIGLTGGISTGKSTVSSILDEKGFKIIDADKIARNVVEKGKDAYFKIIEYYGKDILSTDGDIDRKALGNIIFNDKNLRESLNSITHPYIFKEIKNQIENMAKNNSIIFLDVPLLFEQYRLWREYSIEFNEIWLVYCDKDTQINRLMKRDDISKEEAEKKINSQMSLDKKKTMSSKTIDNSKDLGYLKKQIEELLKVI